MAAGRLSMRQIKEVLRQKWVLGRTHRDVAESVGIDLGARGRGNARGRGRGRERGLARGRGRERERGRGRGRRPSEGGGRRPSVGGGARVFEGTAVLGAVSRPTPAITEYSSLFLLPPKSRTTSGTSTPSAATDATSSSIFLRLLRSPGCGRFS